jgi:hypothetical protein
MRTPEGFDLDVVLKYLPSDFAVSPSSSLESTSSTEVNKVAFLMALFGWQGHTHGRMGAQLGSVACQACFRVLGLWLFKSKSVNGAGEEVTGPVVNGLDVSLEHRDYCPWRNAVSQNGQHPTVKSSTNRMAGWEIVVRILKNEYHLGANQEAPKRAPQPYASRMSEPPEEVDDADVQSIRDEKDKERVKALFFLLLHEHHLLIR